MSNELPIPPELQHLLEKRSGEDRRKKVRRKVRRRQADLGPLGSLESAANLDQAALEERRGSGDRRKADRRRQGRRKA